MLAELARREKEANIKPDPDIDLFMKVTFTYKQNYLNFRKPYSFRHYHINTLYLMLDPWVNARVIDAHVVNIIAVANIKLV